MELLSVLDAVRCRHFTLLLALLIGFACGVLAPLANAMTSEIFSTHRELADLVISSTFDFNGTLTYPNGSVIVPPAFSRYKPYDAMVNSRSPGGQYVPWTKDSSAFESFSLNSTGAYTDALVETELQTFSTQFGCVPLQYSLVHDGSSQSLTAFAHDENGDFPCSLPIHHNLTVFFPHGEQKQQQDGTDAVRAWLNLSSCSDSDPSKLFVTATVAYVDILGDSSNGVEVEDGFLFFPSTVRNITGLVCSVEFLLWNANVTAKGSSGEIVAHNFSESSIPTKIDANFTMASVLIYLDAFMYFLWNPSENKYLHNSSTVVDAASDSTNISEMDFFFGILTDGDRENLEKYFHDPERFQLDVQTLGSSILTQVVNFQARRNSSIPVTGNLRVVRRRLILHHRVLVVFQVFLALIGCAVLLFSTTLRPKCPLLSDPGRFAAGALVLLNSGSEVKNVFDKEALQSEKSTQRNLESLEWNLRSTPEGIPYFDVRKFSGPNSFSNNTEDTCKHSGWRPLALRFGSKAMISIMLLGTSLSLIRLQLYSRKSNGITQNRHSVQFILHFTSTSILVVLGYVCSGVDAAIGQVAPYRNLRKVFGKRRLFSECGVKPAMMAMSQSRIFHIGLSRTISTSAILLLPILKVVASGLYSLIPVETARSIQPRVDSSLVTQPTHFWEESIANTSDTSMGVLFRSLLMTQLTSMRSNARPGILDNLLLSDLTYDLDCETTAGLANVKMHTRVPAISIDVSVQIEAAQLYVQNASVEDDLGCWRIGVWNCPDMFGPTVGPSETCVKQHNRFYGQADYTEGAFTLCLAHLPEIFGPVGNTTSIVLDKKLDPGDLNVSFPQVSSIRSWVNLTQVYVNTTYECTIRNIWTPIEYDRSTIDPLELTEQHHKLKFNNYTAAFLTGQLYGDSFEVDLSVSFFALLAFYAETQLQNWTALLDGDQLAEAVKNSIIAYCAELLTEYRTIARKQAKLENVEPQKVNATLFRPILPKSPGSIAAQLSFIADSNLVRCLREDGMTRLTDDEIRGKLALGWWKREITPQDRIRGEGEETNFENDPPPLPSLRWGIDIGEPYSRQRWNKPPFFDQESENDDDHESQNEEAQNDGRSRLVDLQSQIELQNLPSRRDSETQSDEHQQQRQEENTEDASGDRSNKNTLGLDFGDTQSLNPLLIEPRFNDAASEDQRSEYSKAGNERSEAQSVAECISQPLLGPNLR
ncbi:hypothetical protein HDK64DRAFT_328342 [Phyllosticta capitalensis]